MLLDKSATFKYSLTHSLAYFVCSVSSRADATNFSWWNARVMCAGTSNNNNFSPNHCLWTESTLHIVIIVCKCWFLMNIYLVCLLIRKGYYKAILLPSEHWLTLAWLPTTMLVMIVSILLKIEQNTQTRTFCSTVLWWYADSILSVARHESNQQRWRQPILTLYTLFSLLCCCASVPQFESNYAMDY